MRLTCLALWISLSMASRALAQDARDALELSWSAPAECGDAARVREAVARRLGGGSVARAQPLAASGRIDRIERGYALTLVLPGGERRLEAVQCAELVESAAVILALVIDPQTGSPTQTEPEAETEPEPEPEPVAEPEPEPDAAPASEDAPAPPRSSEPAVVSAGLRAELLVDFGLLPAAAVGPGLAIAVGVSRTQFELAAGYLPTQEVQREGGPVVGDLRAFLVRFGVCQMFGSAPELGPCLGLEYTRMVGSGEVEDSEDVDAPLWVFVAAARLALPIGDRFDFTLEVGAGLPTIDTGFTVNGEMSVHEIGVVVGRVRTGFTLRF